MELNINVKDKILIVSPHEDDETIGCGGLLLKYGELCDVLMLTDGRHGVSKKFNNSDELISIRSEEFKCAISHTKVNNFSMLNIEDGHVVKNKDTISKYDIRTYDYIFVPNRYETHDDHKYVLNIFKKMCYEQHSAAKLFEYEVWTPLRTPTHYLDISDVIAEKKKMLNEYESQLADRNYLNAMIGLNNYRGININAEYAEAYMYSKYDSVFAVIYNLLPISLKNIIKKIVAIDN